MNRGLCVLRLIVACTISRFILSPQLSGFMLPTDNKCSRSEKGDKNMLGIIAGVLIVLWLLGFFAFHVTTAFVHAALVVGLVLLVLHFVL
jgi:hypothetical protein